MAVLALAGSLALAGCSGSESPSEEPDSQNTATGQTLSGQWPLTGLPAEGAAPEHPVMVVKIDNTSSSNPQVGLSKADLVTEELVEGGSTRLAVFYYSQLPKNVGPVRSFRATDIGIVQPADGVLVASGGAGPTVQRMKQAGIKTFTEGAAGYSRDNSRQAPYNLFMSLPKLAKQLKTPKPPENYFPWGDEADFPAGQPAKGLHAKFSAGHTTSWRYKGGKYLNTNSEAPGNDQFKPDTVLVIRAKVGDAGYLDPAGNPVPETKFTGQGQAMVFHGGKMVRATWVKRGLNAPVQFKTKAGELTLPPGQVWMELVPAKDGNVQVVN
ncbi:MAG: DUF3048 domain-containing protein [Pseudonocardia sp.]